VTLVVLVVIVFFSRLGGCSFSSQLPSNLYFNRQSQASLLPHPGGTEMRISDLPVQEDRH
jgi:hypothetical protein